MKKKKILKRVLPFTLACVSTIMLSSGCQNKINNDDPKFYSVVLYSDSEKIVDGLIYLDSKELKVLEIYDQINNKTNYYLVKPTLKYSLDSREAKNIASLRFNDTDIKSYIANSSSSYTENSFESIFKDGIYLWIDSLSSNNTPYYGEHTYINIKGNNFYHIEINYLIKNGDTELQNEKQVYTRLNDVLYSLENEVFKIKVFDFEDIYEKGLYSYEELEVFIAQLNNDNSRKLTNN
ncbi:MAG: hypothetical protein E7163_05465 [Firmicutes bacterium]|nr:hypothetical protein [Bacillota bacterium]